MMMNVQILPYGRNQTAAVKYADVNFMVRRVLQTMSYNLRLSTKICRKIKQQLEQELDEELPSTVEMKSVCDQFRCCKDCLVSYKVKDEVPHKCLHAKCKHCLEYIHIYDHQCFITSEEEKQFKRRLQDLRRKKKKNEQLLGMVVEGLPDDHTQSVIDDLIVERKKKLKDSKEINSGVPMVEIKAQRNEERVNDLRVEVMEQMMDEGVSFDYMTLDMVDKRMAKLQDKRPQTNESKKIFADGLVCADIECILDSTNTFIPILIFIHVDITRPFFTIGEPVVRISLSKRCYNGLKRRSLKTVVHLN